MKVRVVSVVAMLALGLCLDLAAQKRTGAPMVQVAGQKVDIQPPVVPKLLQRCENWAVAADLEALLAAQQVPLPQRYWVVKGDMGEVCRDNPIDFVKLRKMVEGEYVLDSGAKVRLEMVATEGAPTVPDAVIAELKREHPAILFWKNRAYLLLGVTYDEYVYPNGQRMFEIREMRLRDPYLSAAAQPVTFVKGRDDAAEIGGIVQVKVEKIEAIPWQR
jgi:hypothetical protein